MKIVYVTGCLGFIGSYVTRLCLERGWYVKGVDSMTYAANKTLLDEFNKHDNFSFVCGHDNHGCDINDLTFLYDCDYIINTAAETHVGNSIANSDDFVFSNVNGVHNILELLRNYRQENTKTPTLLHFSTDEVYGDMDDYGPSVLANEEFNLIGSSYYSSTKASADLLVQAAGRTYGLPYLITRTCNNYGKNQHQEKLLPTIINCIKNNIKINLTEKNKQYIKNYKGNIPTKKEIFTQGVEAGSNYTIKCWIGETVKVPEGR